MANEVVWTYADQVTLEASGTSAASDAFLQAADVSLTSANHSNFPMCDLALTADFGATPTNGVVRVYRRDMNIDGTADAVAPSSSFPRLFVGSIPIPGSASATYPLPDVPLSKDCDFYIENATGQNISAGWVLKATPKTYEPSA